MTDHDRNPELRALEHRLKTLRPKRVTLDAANSAVPSKAALPKRDNRRLRLRIVGALAAVVTTAVSLMVIVGFYGLWLSSNHCDVCHDNTTMNAVAGPPEHQPPTMLLTVSSASRSERHDGYESPTIHRQLAMLLDEMAIRETVPEKKPDYPVIEITVSTEPQKQPMFHEHPKILRAGNMGMLTEAG
ncbi:MAG: hypothetical protein FWC50_03130 [Planctomycetaceae bacterium]|nr:hypothetical protein [Planctomycetaceae bacterium]